MPLSVISTKTEKTQSRSHLAPKLCKSTWLGPELPEMVLYALGGGGSLLGGSRNMSGSWQGIFSFFPYFAHISEVVAPCATTSSGQIQLPGTLGKLSQPLYKVIDVSQTLLQRSTYSFLEVGGAKGGILGTFSEGFCPFLTC